MAYRGCRAVEVAAAGRRRRGSRAALVGLGGEADAGLGAEGSGLGKDPGVEAESVRCSAGAPVWQSGVAAAAQSGGTAELRCCGG